MENKKSYIRHVKYWTFVLLTSLGISIIVIDVINSYHDFHIRVAKMKKDYIEQQKVIIQHEVNHMINSINVTKQRYVLETKNYIHDRVIDAYNMADNIYRQNKGKMTDDEIKKTILDALRTIRFMHNSGFYFITDTNGTRVLCTHDPEQEGKNFLNAQDISGKYYIKDIINIANNYGQGFYTFYTHKPGQEGNDFKKTVYVKLFEPFNWIIGTGFYEDNINRIVKEDFIRTVNESYYGKNGYFVLCDWNGTTIAHGVQPELIGKNMWDTCDKKGNKFIQQLITVSQSKQGGYITYWWRKPDTQVSRPKIVFAKGIPEWKYTLGTGAYIDDLEPVILAQQKIMVHRIKERLILLFIFITLTFVIFILFFNKINSRLYDDFKQFISFFKQMVNSNKEIDRNLLKFTEFDEMADSANEMLREKIKMQQALLDEKEQLLVTLRSIGDGVITTDINARIEMMNSVAEKITGWSAEDAKGKPLTEVFKIIDEETREIGDNPVARVLKEEHVTELSAHSILIAKDGSEYYISDSAAPIRGADSKIRGVVLVFRDITEQHKAEEIIFNTRKLESIGILAGGIAHDFNNVLTGLFGNIELAKLKLAPENDAYPFIEMAEQALERTTELTQQLLTFAKGGTPVLSSVNLRDELCELVKFNLSGSNVKAEFSLAENLWQIKADKAQVSQVIANLVINAKQAMDNGGVLYVSAENVKDVHCDAIPEMRGDFVKMVIKDTGCGISPKNINKIFDPYFTTKQNGSGLGLATVHSIITRHNGYIYVESKPDNGTTFTVFWPVSKNEELISEKSTKINIPEPSDAILGRILIMDDEDIIIKTATAMLKKCGYVAESAKDGEDAIEKYISAQKNGTPFDIIIMDLTIPGGMGGAEAIDKLLQIDSTVKVIVSSGYSADPVLANYADYGFKGRLIKPFKMKDLARELAYVMQF